MVTEGASLTELFTSRDGRFRYSIKPFDREDEEQVTFLRRRLSLEVPNAMSSFFRVAMDAEQSVVLVAFRVTDSPPTSPTSATVVAPSEIHERPIGVVLFDVSVVPRKEVAALLWISVLFDMRGVGVGSRLLVEGERDVASLGAIAVETSSRSSTDFCHAKGYARCTNPVYYAPSCAARKTLKELDTAAAAVTTTTSAKAQESESGDVSHTSHRAPASLSRSKPVAAARERVEKRPRQAAPSSLPKAGHQAKPSSAQSKATRGKAAASARPSSAASPWPSSDSSSSAARPTTSNEASSNGSVSGESGESGESDGESDGGVLYDIPTVPDAIVSGAIFLRLATPEDKKSWWNLILATTHYNVGGTELLPSTLEAAFRVVAVRQTDGAIVGLIAMQEDGWITFLCTDESYQGQGMGSFLLFVALEWARRHGLESASLSPLKPSLVRYYQRWGFEEDAPEHKKKKKHARGEAVTMTRTFDPTFALLPNGARLDHYVGGYDAVAEVAPHDGRTYYWYYPKRKARRTPRKEPTAPTTEAPKNTTGTPFSQKVSTLWSWISSAA